MDSHGFFCVLYPLPQGIYGYIKSRNRNISISLSPILCRYPLKDIKRSILGWVFALCAALVTRRMVSRWLLADIWRASRGTAGSPAICTRAGGRDPDERGTYGQRLVLRGAGAAPRLGWKKARLWRMRQCRAAWIAATGGTPACPPAVGL